MPMKAMPSKGGAGVERYLLTCLVILLAVVVGCLVYALSTRALFRAVGVIAQGAPDGAWLSFDAWHWPEEAVRCMAYTVGHGDTLWAIAKRYYPDANLAQIVWAIRLASDLTGPEGPVLQPGQVIWIPDPGEYGVGVAR